MSLPSSMDYTKILPIAAGNPRAMRRTFQPVNGTSFTATGNNIIRIDLQVVDSYGQTTYEEQGEWSND